MQNQASDGHGDAGLRDKTFKNPESAPIDELKVQPEGEPPTDPWIGQTLEQTVQINALIGEGGMSVVYQARDCVLGRDVAVKFLSPKLSRKPEAMRRFQREAMALAQLDHRGIVKVYRCSTTQGGAPYMVMQLVNGRSLADRLRESDRLATEQSVNLVIQLCDALAYAHERQIVHRDLKPGNIILEKGEDGLRPVIIDFGIVRLLEGGEMQDLTRTGDVFGSPLYMSPEQCRGARVDYRTDIYSLGCILFECLAGSPPFSGESALVTMMMHMQEPVPKLEERSFFKFEPRLDHILQRALAKSPEDRYDSAQQFKDDLVRYQHGESIQPYSKKEPLRLNKISIAGVAIAAIVAVVALIKMWTPNSPTGVVGYQPIHGSVKPMAMASTQADDDDGDSLRLTHWPPPRWVNSVTVYSAKMTKARVQELLQRCPSVHALALHHATRGAIHAMSSFPDLRRVDLSHCSFRGTDLVGMQNLRELVAKDTNLGAHDIPSLPKTLHDLVLTNSKSIDDYAVKELSRVTNLRRLWLGRTSITDACVRDLCKMTFLSRLAFVDTRISRENKLKIIRALPNCLVEAGLPSSEGGDQIPLSSAENKDFRKMLKAGRVNSGSIRSVKIFGPDIVSDLHIVSSFKNLTSLSITGDKGLHVQKGVESELRRVSPDLSELTLSNLALTPDVVPQLLRQTKLRNLYIKGNCMNDAALLYLSHLQSLQTLDIRDAEPYPYVTSYRQLFTDHGVDSFLKANRECSVRFTTFIVDLPGQDFDGENPRDELY